MRLNLEPERMIEVMRRWNVATRPGVLRTDLEHQRASRYSRRLYKIIQRYRRLMPFEINELSNGALRPSPHAGGRTGSSTCPSPMNLQNCPWCDQNDRLTQRVRWQVARVYHARIECTRCDSGAPWTLLTEEEIQTVSTGRHFQARPMVDRVVNQWNWKHVTILTS